MIDTINYERQFDITENQETRNETRFRSHITKTTKYGLESLSYLGRKLYGSGPDYYKNLSAIEEFLVKKDVVNRNLSL